MRSDLAVAGANPSAIAAFDLLADWRQQMGLTANLPGLTVVRIRGALQFNLTAGPGATSGVLLGARKTAIQGLGPASPLPSTSPLEDWMLFDWAPLTMGWAGGSISGTDSFSYALDIKSKRRLDEPQETIGLWAETTRDADTMSLYGWISVLIALP
jgi:hypothetical protein